ncbi:TRAP transporter small permease [Shimia aestuarii]|uniref:TRAP transporter small permease n=1 Tax=Shimia aestuarii TaxID=254406 RepID=UPI001FB4AD51|nr:TRAP transporter small permease [Shimia aestuarii]
MNKLLSGYQTFLDWLEKAAMALAMMLTALLFLNTANGIIVDQVVGNSLVWIEEVNNLLFAWAVFVGAGVVARHGGHIGVDMVYSVLGPRLQLLMRIGYLVLALIIVWVMVYYGVKMALFVGKYQTSLYLDINLFYYYLSVPVGGVLLGLFSIGATLPDPREPTESTSDEMPTAGVDQ